MKKTILKSSVLITIAFILSLPLFFLLPVNSASAQLKFKPQINIPGGIKGETAVGSKVDGEMYSTLLGDYIKGIYNYSFAIAGILAAIVLMGGGVLWLISGGNQTKVAQAKDIIGGSLIGLVILFSAYIILNTINPALLEMPAISIKGVDFVPTDSNQIACCGCELFYLNKSGLSSGPPKYTCESGIGITREQCENICYENAYKFETENLKPHDFKITYEIDYICGERENPFANVNEHQEEKISVCIPPPENKQYLIYSDKFDSSGWTFDEGIDKQISAMSSELAQFLNCMRNNLPDGVGKISSISDSNHISDLTECDQPNCPVMLCVHSCQSCHYGGGTNINKSYAVDLGDEENFNYFKKAANICDSGSFILNGDDHIHISVSACPRN
jgi:hypothetical protein